MDSANPCNVCGSKDLNLIDGFYYCVECGTQDVTARETVIEQGALEDGTFAVTFKRKIQQIHDDNIEMSGEWYKWHAYNFILAGLADELIGLGAKPSFKMKLLWVWTRYIKIYQDKEELGLVKNVVETSDTNSKNEDQATAKPEYYPKVKDCFFRRTNYVTPLIILSIIYIALNIDKSDIQLSHLLTFLKEKRLSLYNIFKYLPKDIKVKNIPDWQLYMGDNKKQIIFSPHRIRIIALTLLKKLDLGYPVIPDIRRLIETYTTELCLPNDIRQLVYSLLHLYPCDFFNSRDKAKVTVFPDFEGVLMSYVLVALKMTFGLDDDYELRLSDTVEDVNKKENYLKCYICNFMETDRLFSFREWLNYIQFRKKILYQNCLLTDTEHYNDVDDYMYIEHVIKEEINSKISLEDEITLNILNKIPLDELDIIPKSCFEGSLTPMTTYSKVIAENHKETDVRVLISEDFSRYSLKYACEEINLVNMGRNMILGVNRSNKKETGEEIEISFFEKANFEMVFIKNCENKNWMTTKPPSMDHVTIASASSDVKDSESDLGYDSHAENSNDKDLSTEKKLETIREEDDTINIYDDDFIEIYYKEEVEAAAIDDFYELTEDHQPIANNDPIFSDEDDNYYDTPEFNPNTFNRERVIKELILAACKKYKIPIPKEYREEKVSRKRLIRDEAGVRNEPKVKRARSDKPGETKQKLVNILEKYYSCVQNDVVNQISKQLQEAIRNVNETENFNHDTDFFSDTGQNVNIPPIIPDGDSGNGNEICEPKNNVSLSDQTELEVIESTLFENESDGERDLDEINSVNNPKFNENEFDTKQLFIKVKQDEEVSENEEFDILEIAKDEEIKEILSRKTKEYRESDKIINIKPNDYKDTFKADDYMPLAVLRAEKMFQRELKERMNEKKEELIKNDNIPEFNYWLKHYRKMDTMRDVQVIFDNEMKKSMPKNFRVILNECAGILNCSQFHLYRCMQNLETKIMGKNSDFRE